VFIGTSPWDVAAAIAAVPTPSPAVEAFVPDDVPEGVPAGIQLGFADGSVVTLEEDDPRALALRAAAARLTGRD
jgi:hypothetical protein